MSLPRALTLASTLALVGACGGTTPSTPDAGGGGGHGGSSDAGGTAGTAGADGGADDASGARSPSCAAHGPGLDDCGATHESCCRSLLVAGGTFERTYEVLDAGVADAADGGSTTSDPATLSDFKLDKYDVTVGRFRQFVRAVRAAGNGGDGGVDATDAGGADASDAGAAGWRPVAGSGTHAHLAGGLGLTSVGADGGAAHEPGWLASDDDKLAPSDTSLSSCGPSATWTATAGDHEHLPMNCVTWWEAYAFCIWDGGFLPSETEWEYAAAGGKRQLEYPWGLTDPGTANLYAIYDCHYPNGSLSCTDVSNIAPVGTATMGAGRWGQLDLVGNEWQWSLDWYAPYAAPCSDCAQVAHGSSRVVRGGGFGDAASNLRPTYRNANDPGLRNDFIGIRCARTP